MLLHSYCVSVLKKSLIWVYVLVTNTAVFITEKVRIQYLKSTWQLLLSAAEIPLQSFGPYEKRPSKNLKGPLRVVRLCLLGVIVPSLVLGVPLYLRYNIYGAQLYPLAMSDMRMIDNRVSTTWCQKQRIKTNTTFNAFLLSEPPELSNSLTPISMVRHLILEDDTKEYWGFYLLKGSSVTVNTCVRWPGASLIVIRGHRHLHECAYIGDDSSEELDELMEAIKEGTYVGKNENLVQSPNSNESKTNDPEMMKRHRADVTFHSPVHQVNKENYTIKDNMDLSDLNDPKVMKTILEAIQNKKKKKQKVDVEDHPHFKRNTTVAKNETANFNIHAPGEVIPATSQELLAHFISRLESLGEKGPKLLEELNKKYATEKGTENVDTPNESSQQKRPEQQHTLETQGRHYHKPAVNFNKDIDSRRRRRRNAEETIADFNKDDSDNNQAVEEGFEQAPDGIANHRGKINETTDHDMSNSEFWSSFSSSEEALLNCEGLILNLPLTPHHNCRRDLSEQEAEETYLANSITYRVPVNGYYFFVFNSENEVQPNYIRVQFHLNKAVYNLTNTVAVCANTSHTCEVDLKFFSSEKLVLELPIKENDTFWNEEFIIESECEPRTALYAVCVIAVPVIIILVAFS